MCKGNYKKHAVGSVSSDYELIAFAVAGGLGAAAVINPLGRAVFSKDPEKAKKYAPYIKLALGYIAMTQFDDERIQSAGFGAMVVGGVEAAQTLAPTVFQPIRAKVEGIGEIIDLSSEMYGVDDAYAVGEVNAPYAVSGGVS